MPLPAGMHGIPKESPLVPSVELLVQVDDGNLQARSEALNRVVVRSVQAKQPGHAIGFGEVGKEYMLGFEIFWTHVTREYRRPRQKQHTHIALQKQRNHGSDILFVRDRHELIKNMEFGLFPRQPRSHKQGADVIEYDLAQPLV